MKSTIQTRLIVLFVLSIVACSNSKLIEVKDANNTVIEKYVVNKDGLKDGLYEAFYESGTLKESATYVDNKLQGERKIYYKNGNLEIEEFYENDVLIGDYKNYDENGNLILLAKYVDGAMNGLLTSYYSDGTIQEEVMMKDNQENGPFKEYYENGQLHWSGTYLNGDNEFGELLEYDEEGTLLKKMNCDSLAVCRTVWTKDKGVVVPKY